MGESPLKTKSSPAKGTSVGEQTFPPKPGTALGD